MRPIRIVVLTVLSGVCLVIDGLRLLRPAVRRPGAAAVGERAAGWPTGRSAVPGPPPGSAARPSVPPAPPRPAPGAGRTPPAAGRPSTTPERDGQRSAPAAGRPAAAWAACRSRRPAARRSPRSARPAGRWGRTATPSAARRRSASVRGRTDRPSRRSAAAWRLAPARRRRRRAAQGRAVAAAAPTACPATRPTAWRSATARPTSPPSPFAGRASTSARTSSTTTLSTPTGTSPTPTPGGRPRGPRRPCWRGATWATLASACGYPPQPVVYDYGTTIVYEDNRVYYNGDPVATAEEYAEQAAAIADRGEQAKVSDKEEWTPLGVFGMVKGEDTEANQIFQLAINKDGVLRGNYYDALSDTTLPVHGAVDKRTQRAAWTVGDRKETVYETGHRQPDGAGDDDAGAFRQGPHAAMDAHPIGGAGGAEIGTRITSNSLKGRHDG